MSLYIDNKKIERFWQMLQSAKYIAIVSHVHPDGDAIGSVLGMAHLIRLHLGSQSDCQVVTMLPNDCPDYFRFLPGADAMLSAERELGQCEAALKNADLVIGVDFNSAPRISTLQTALEQSPAQKILVDHHLLPDEQLFDLMFSCPGISSTCELIYWIARHTWGENCLDTNSATCLYTGVCTDTGSFAFSNEESSLYEAAAAMVQFPIGAADLHSQIFNTYSVARMQFLGFCINERLRILEDLGFAYFYISIADQNRFGVGVADIEGIVNYTLMMQSITVGALIKETPVGMRISFRSRNEFDVNDFARKYFPEGGGHKKAAGASSSLPLNELVNYVEDNMCKELRAFHAHQQ